jgi:ATP-dependent DNA helicase Q1
MDWPILVLLRSLIVLWIILLDQQDQMNQFCPNVCVALHSGQTKSDISAIWRRIRDPDQQVGMLIVTPERVAKSKQLKSELQHLYVSGRLARIVIDECHCCCQWGHDFRPDYAKLGVLRQTFTTVPILAVTATASDRVREDCARILQLRPHYRFFRSTANRPNLTYRIHRKEGPANDTLDDMVKFIQTKYPASAGIVYTRTRKEADTVAQQLQERGIPAAAYYSDVAPTRKNQIHQSWMRNQTQVVVATIAFGLGINKPDVRFVIHHSMSKTLEAYYQESGRAGRDGNPADCVLYYSPKDVPKMLSMVHGEQSSQLTWTMIKYAQQFGSDAVCRSILLHNLGEADGDMEAVIQAFHASTTSRDVLTHSQTVLQLLYAMQDEQVTMPMLVKEWRRSKSSNFECVQKNPPSKDLSVFECEYIIVALLLQQLIATDCQYTAYDLVVYLRCTPRAEQFLTSPKASFTIRLPPAEKKPAKSSSSPTESNEWISTKKTPAKRKRSTSTTTTKSTKKKKRSPTSAAAATTAKKKKAPKAKKTSQAKIRSSIVTKTPKEPEVIDIEDDDSTLVDASKARRSVARRVPVLVNSDDLMDDTDEEYEFDG